MELQATGVGSRAKAKYLTFRKGSKEVSQKGVAGYLSNRG
jgi:hypothetical protein